MCKFCEGKSYTREIIISDENEKMPLNSTNNLVVIGDWDYPAYVEFSIKHCPVCGRSLE